MFTDLRQITDCVRALKMCFIENSKFLLQIKVQNLEWFPSYRRSMVKIQIWYLGRDASVPPFAIFSNTLESWTGFTNKPKSLLF